MHEISAPSRGVKGAQQRLAVYQFLQFAHRMRGHPNLRKEDPKRAFLNYVRRLEQIRRGKTVTATSYVGVRD